MLGCSYTKASEALDSVKFL